ncbi:RICIN domain-containing protein [Streptomyces sp. NPDC058301]|uniref:RICIN domain-containing protein n=1 Tax=Streptomyces sp. NPDC058301 TaxID=3346436 RepID=UPI0036EBC07C
MFKLRKARAKIIALCVCIPALVLGAEASTASATGTYYFLKNANSSKCLAVGAASANNGAGVIQWDCTYGATEQYWSLNQLPSKVVNGETYYHVVNSNSTAVRGTAMCLAVPGGTTAWNTQLMQWPCGDWNDHWWKLVPNPAYGGWELKNLNGLCAAVGAGSKVSGAPVIQWGCTAGPEQTWFQP